MTQDIRCSSCGNEAYPSLILNDRMAMVPSCPACGHEHGDVQANDMAVTPIAPQEKTPSRKEKAPFTAAVASTDLLGQIRERVQYLDLEIAKAAGYMVERKKLARMLHAAETMK